MKLKAQKVGRHDTQYNDNQHNDTQHNDNLHSDSQFNDNQHNDIQYKGLIWDTQHKDTVNMLSVMAPILEEAGK